MRGLFVAATFLTRVRLPAGEVAPVEVGRATPWFPVVGAAVGAAIGGVYALLALALPAVPAAILAAAAGALLTGAFHEDALGDVADAFGGGMERARRLEILRDSRHGTYGVLAICVAFLLRASLIASLPPARATLALVAAHALSRAPLAALLASQPVASATGLGAGTQGEVRAGHAAGAATVGLVIAMAATGMWSLGAAVAVVLVAAGMAALARRAIGGISGDVLGATQQVAEAAVLCLAVAAWNSDLDWSWPW